MKHNQHLKKQVFVTVLVFLLSALFISGEPPTLHSITGYVHNTNDEQVGIGTPVTINATETESFIKTSTNGPGGHTGFYGVLINATDNETTIVTSFNSTNYGRVNVSLLGNQSVTHANITFNLTRPAETNTTIPTPANNSNYDLGSIFNVTIRVTAIGGADSQNCNITLTIANQTVINITGTNFTADFGNITLGSTNSSNFSMKALTEGNSIITVDAECSSDTESFDHVDSIAIILSVNQQAPTLHTIQGYIHEIDNVTQVAAGTNVSINATTTKSFITIETNGPPGETGFYSAVINATDGELVIVTAENETHTGSENTSLGNSPEVTRLNVTIDTLKGTPVLSSITVDDPFGSPENEIDLIAGGTQKVNCTAEVSDLQGFGDIDNVTAIFYDSNVSNVSAVDDNNEHYTNNTCSLLNCAGNDCDVQCSFDIYYYANSHLESGWVCSMRATDSSNADVVGTDDVNMNQLISLEIPATINFGSVTPNNVSVENITNVTNVGNVPIGISIDGYGAVDGDGLAMNCTSGQNITSANERYNLSVSNSSDINHTQFIDQYQAITDTAVNHTEFNLHQRQNDTDDDGQKASHWRVYINPGQPAGDSCSGVIQIAAISIT